MIWGLGKLGISGPGRRCIDAGKRTTENAIGGARCRPTPIPVNPCLCRSFARVEAVMTPQRCRRHPGRRGRRVMLTGKARRTYDFQDKFARLSACPGGKNFSDIASRRSSRPDRGRRLPIGGRRRRPRAGSRCRSRAHDERAPRSPWQECGAAGGGAKCRGPARFRDRAPEGGGRELTAENRKFGELHGQGPYRHQQPRL